VNTATPSAPPPPSELRAVNDRLDTVQAFRRFVGRVSVRAGRWLACRGVPEADRDDILQDALLQTYKRRESYNPAQSSWESWAFGFLGQVVLNYRRQTAKRTRREADAAVDLLSTTTDAPSPEEEAEAAMTKGLLEKCWASLDDDSRALLHASAEGIEMTDIAAALGLSRSATYDRLKTVRARLQAALDREQRGKLALGVLVLPASIDQLIASHATTAHVSADAMRRVWKSLDRAMSADLSAGKLRDDGTEVARYMGSPNAAPRARLGARLVRALGPRAIAALTHVGVAVVSVGVTYALMRRDPTHDGTIVNARTAPSVVAGVEDSRDPAPPETAAPASARSSGAVEEPDLRVDAGAAERTDAGSGPSMAGRDSIAREQALIDSVSTAYQSGNYEDAIKALREHANKYPRGQFSASRERLFVLALIRVGQKSEARQRIARLRQASPGSPLLAELDAAVNAHGP
jgi:RNA polymerase sigma factor (sigma-70 family)